MAGSVDFIRNYIAQGETARALQAIRQFNNEDWTRQAILLESRHTKVNERRRLNLISSDEAAMEEAKISNAILEICREIEATANPAAHFDNEPPFFKRAEPLRKNSVFDKYRILQPLGSGGFGDVYQAEHMYLPRVVALKIAHQFKDDTGVVKHLIAYTLSTLSKLNHPNIVPVIDAGFSDNRYFIVTQFIEGMNLRQYMARHPLNGPADLRKRLVIFDKICQGLEYCHTTPQFVNGFKQPSIFHGDIKPENVLIRASDSEPLLTDFMMLDFDQIYHISFLNQLNAFSANASTIYGTPRYMAEEQATDGISEQTEIYSLGMVLGELTGFPQALAKWTPELRKIFTTAIAPNPADRYENVKTLRAQLQPLIEA